MADLRFLTAGESHGPALTVIVEGMPSGVPITPKEIAGELERRRRGYGRGARMKLEADRFEVLGGVRLGRTLGSPVSVVIHNTEWSDPAKKWSSVMAIEDTGQEPRAETRPRPGHVDLVGMLKYDTKDARDVLERASARETAARTVAGVFAKALLAQLDIHVISHVISIGGAAVTSDTLPTPMDLERLEASECRTLDPESEARMIAEIDAAKADGDTLGGVIEIVAYGAPLGLGSHVHWDRKLDARLAGALVSVQAIKGVEIGDAFLAARSRGSEVMDEILWDEAQGYHRTTGRSGGIEAGTSTGSAIRIRVAMKPFSTLRRALRTVDVSTHEPATAIVERSDVCGVPSACVVVESVVAFTLAQALLEKFGGDSLRELAGNVARWNETVRRA